MEYQDYTIKKGDTLSDIAKKYTGSANNYNKIAKINNIQNPDRIFAGITIKIPVNKKETKTTSPTKYILKPQDLKLQLQTFKQNRYSSTFLLGKTRLLNNVSNIQKKQKRKDLPVIDVEYNDAQQKDNTYIQPKRNKTKTLEELNRPNIIEKGIGSVKKQIRLFNEFGGDVYRTLFQNDIRLIPDIINRGVRKTLGIEDETQNSSGFTDPVLTKLTDFGIPSFYGDTIRNTYLPVSDQLYLIPENINLHDVRLSGRNRGDYNLRKTEGVVIPTYRPIVGYDEYIANNLNTLYRDSEGHVNKYIGYDPEGNFKVGTIDDFQSGDSLTQTFYGKILNPIYNDDGTLSLTTGFKDSRRKSPMFRGINEDGDTVVMSYPLMTPLKRDNRKTNKYDNVVGGGMLVTSGNEQRIIRGSIDDVVKQIEELRKRHPGEDVNYYEIDNASYNRGLRTYNKLITPQDWRKYDALNNHAGHAMYIRP